MFMRSISSYEYNDLIRTRCSDMHYVQINLRENISHLEIKELAHILYIAAIHINLSHF